MFQLHERLAQDSVLVGELPLCQIRLAKDARYPWLILVPKQNGTRELHQLTADAQQQLMKESCSVAAIMEQHLTPDKINVASLGNVVEQLHLHHVARFQQDDAWPGPIWGAHPGVLESEQQLQDKRRQWQQWLAPLERFKPAP
ncbi:Diadenosine tetraphosphate (Ap4A) hydrolase [Ferrimonas sediminum]|uniref:Diadenosine tetraphosphate (Ap4A) hydrolase n=1 Tax=Ferrimonas sediminum TaxID=718193 RepID=A0A1G8SSZ8_9GAMM|nr:HIT domain-containing protein [Ferrimonas sediminum]SDJ32359.1 Diadenosine tetraphosphate (Ap4A) hydrolase [Ferrimonas sediminum]